MYNILYILTLSFSFILSAPVSITEANKVSENVYNQFNLDKRFSYSIKDVQIIKDADIDLIYIYHLNPNGYILGIESTAHTFSIGLADSEGYPLDSVSVAVRPLKGGIHPREAADHHAEKAADEEPEEDYEEEFERAMGEDRDRSSFTVTPEYQYFRSN